MKKIEIIKLIEANKIIENNKDILSIVEDKRICNRLIDKQEWFPKIEELKKEFSILSKEIEHALKETNNSKKYITNINCNHEIRLEHYGLFTNHSTCILCGKSFESDNCVNWEYSINRNKYCVNLVAKYQDDDDYGYIEKGYTNNEIYEIIIDILKGKQDEDEVDLVQDIKKLSLKNCSINEEKKVNENYILIIGGSNKQYIDNDSYLHKKGLKIGLELLKYFSTLLYTKVHLFDNEDILENDEINKLFKNNYNLKYTNYDTKEELENNLSKQKNIPYKIIIDLSELYNYKITNNKILKEKCDIKLNKYFPNSKLIRIENMSKKSLEELSEYLKKIQLYSNLYAYQDKKYYFLENDKLESNNLENTCNKIKKLLKYKEV